MSLPPNKNLLAEYPNHYFVETGTFRGDAIQLADDAGFDHIASIDIDPDNIDFCKSRFDLSNPKSKVLKCSDLTLMIGNSATELKRLIQFMDHSITFWLDAHSQLLEDEQPSEWPFPLLMELMQIGAHPIKTHTILIDDILILTHPDVTGWSRKTIEDLILAINPAYKFQYVANPVKQNLLIATV